MSEDEQKDGEAQAQKLLEKYTKLIDVELEKKEKEVMTV
jgi:ribosome recycling factor